MKSNIDFLLLVKSFDPVVRSRMLELRDSLSLMVPCLRTNDTDSLKLINDTLMQFLKNRGLLTNEEIKNLNWAAHESGKTRVNTMLLLKIFTERCPWFWDSLAEIARIIFDVRTLRPYRLRIIAFLFVCAVLEVRDVTTRTLENLLILRDDILVVLKLIQGEENRLTDLPKTSISPGKRFQGGLRDIACFIDYQFASLSLNKVCNKHNVIISNNAMFKNLQKVAVRAGYQIRPHLFGSNKH